IDFLGDEFLAEKLTRQESELFLMQAASFTLAVSPKVIAGQGMTFTISQKLRLPSPHGSVWGANVDYKATIGDQNIRTWEGGLPWGGPSQVTRSRTSPYFV